MQSTRRRLIVVAVMVCGFAVGMAGLLNYFKYRAAADRILTDRLVVTGRLVENSIHSSLMLGLQFAEIGTLPGMLDRERATDDLILGIDVFDTEGHVLYSTDRLRATRPVPPAWIAAAVLVIVGAALAGFLLREYVTRFNKVIAWLDALGLGAYAVVRRSWWPVKAGRALLLTLAPA